MISLIDIQLSFGGREILRGVTLNIQEGECLALVGPNGCGKSTLLRVLAGIEHADSGEIRLPNRATVGYLPQEANLENNHSLEDELLEAYTEVRAALREMQELEHQMAETAPDSPEHERALRRYAECSHLVEHQNGYALESQVRRVASGLGFRPEDFSRSCLEFSGGWQMRILLAKLLLRLPDVLLLDEPTNHLDLESTLWLENWIKNCGRTVLLVTHERATMDRLADRIVCLGQGTAEIYPGDYSKYLQQSQAKRDAQWTAYEQQKKEIEASEAFIRRFRYNANRASLVQSRIKLLDKVERLEPPFHPTAIHFKFPEAPESYRDVLTLENLGHSYDGTPVFRNLNTTIYKGDKVGLVGVNGAGKSTLLRILARQARPTEGRCEHGGRVRSAYFAQYDLTSLASDMSLLEAIERNAPTGEAGRSRDLLGAFLFTGEAVEKPLRVLSGGERTRFRLAQMLFSPANLLLLDEPTNHLDITSRATVEEALRSYQGTVVIVSHDRVFMERVTTRILELDGGVLREFPGSYGDYLTYKESLTAEQSGDSSGAGAASGKSAPVASSLRKAPGAPGAASPTARRADNLSDKEMRQLDREQRKERSRRRKTIERRIEQIEQEIETLEARIAELDTLMADPAVAADYPRLAPLTQERAEALEKTTQLMEEWETLGLELEAIPEGEG
ncbi:MAG TPA: ATP-binding cassette domain-containing protein [Candidatus Sumerlaeota bacterium]|nr:ATP-binding cassette domain-containing protein [Candidatus Sumerlaeota bacterium]